MPYLRPPALLVGLPRVALYHMLPGAPGAASKQRGTARGWVSHSPASKSYDSWGFLECSLGLELLHMRHLETGSNIRTWIIGVSQVALALASIAVVLWLAFGAS